MSKVLVERPRHNCTDGHGLRRTHERLTLFVVDGEIDCDSPKRGKIRGRDHERSKELNENLRPLYEFLKSRVGRPWDSVYSEIRAVLRVDTAIHFHVMQHLRQYVDQYPERDAAFYVDAAGVLRKEAPIKWPRPKPKKSDFMKMSDGAYLWHDRGIWYQLFEEDAVEYVDEHGPLYRGTCMLSGQRSSRQPFRVVVRKKQLSSKELQKYGLSNG